MRIMNGLVMALCAASSLFAQTTRKPGDASGLGGGQQQTPTLKFEDSNYVAKTIPLRHLSNADAVRLLTPYLVRRGLAYEVGPSIHAVTIRAAPKTIVEMEKLLGEYDRSPVTVALNFQLIAAENTNTRDPALAPLDSVLRGVLKFSGYRLLGTALGNVADKGSTTQSIIAGGEEYRLHYTAWDVFGDGPDATVHLTVELLRAGQFRGAQGAVAIDPVIFSTGVTIPMGNTVVLGTTGENDGAGNKALILTVRPQIAKAR